MATRIVLNVFVRPALNACRTDQFLFLKEDWF